MSLILQIVGLAAVFGALLLGALALITGSQARTGIVRTLEVVGKGYRVASTDLRTNGVGGRVVGPVRQRIAGYASALTPSGGRERIAIWLDQAGNPARLSIQSVLEYKGALLIVGGAVGLLAGLFTGSLAGIALCTVIGAALGFYAPNALLSHLAHERQEQIRNTLPDVLDTLVVSVEAGLGFEAALAQVVANGKGPVVAEFARVLHEMQIGKARTDALREMGARTTVTELRSFSSSVVQATTLGVSIANVLRQQAAEMRLRRRQYAEEQAQKVPVKILFPMVLCLFPALFVVVLGPGIIKLVDVFHR